MTGNRTISYFSSCISRINNTIRYFIFTKGNQERKLIDCGNQEIKLSACMLDLSDMTHLTTGGQ